MGRSFLPFNPFDSTKYGAWPRRIIVFVSALAVTVLPALVERVDAQGMGGLQILPTRIIFEGKTRSAQVTLINNGQDTGRYRIGFVNMRMKEDGDLEMVEEPKPGDKFADGLIRFSPRRVVLKPGGKQTVRLLLRKKKDLPPGEYRSHLMFRSFPAADAGQDIEVLDKNKGIRVQLIPIFGLSIPVFVRHGNLTVTVGLENLRLNPSQETDKGPVLSMVVKRQGELSVYGDMSVMFTPKKGGEAQEVGRINGLVIYTSNEIRTLNLTLQPPEGVKLENGTLHSYFRKTKEKGGELLAEAKVVVP